MTQPNNNHIHWIDSMKVLGIYLIVAGHFAVPHYEWLYVFSVQLFFILSGFLNKKQTFKLSIKKLIRQLIIPMLILGLIYNSLQAIQNYATGTFSLDEFFKSIYGLFIGSQPALAGLWFVYTLIIVKLMSTVLPKYAEPFIAVVCLGISFYLNEFVGIEYRNCYVNTLLAYPLFYIGESLSRFKTEINNLSKSFLSVIIILGAIGFILSKLSNDTVWMYMGQYGTNLFSFLIGGIGGTFMCFGICKLFFDKQNKYILKIAEGSLLILAFQNIFISILYTSVDGYSYYIMSLVLLITFIPITIICQRFFPVLLGYRGSSATSDRTTAADSHVGG